MGEGELTQMPSLPSVPRAPHRLQALLLDRDGTLNVERAGYVRTPDELVLLPGVEQAMARAAGWGIPILVLTNQSCVGRGLVSPGELDAIHTRLQQLIEAAGGRIDGFFVCPHHPDEGCGCRKPRPGLLRQAAHRFGLALGQCVFVGDSTTDLQAACAAGCPAIYVGTGRQGPTPDARWSALAQEELFVAPNLPAALDLLEGAGSVAAGPAGRGATVKECA